METYGRFLYVADVAPFAKPSCKVCRGLGFLVRTLKQKKEEIPCGCAMRKFNAKHKDDLDRSGEVIRWKPGKAPAIPNATEAARP